MAHRRSGRGRPSRQVRENLAPYRGLIRPDDFARIVAGKLDSERGEPLTRGLRRLPRSSSCEGGKGTGKTVATLAAIGRLGGNLLTSLEMARAWKQEHAEAQQLRASAIGSRLLVIDDLGTEPDRASGAVAFQELVNRRQGGMRTIITTNLSREQMTTAYDERTIDRLRHGGVMVSLEANRCAEADMLVSKLIRRPSHTGKRRRFAGFQDVIGDGPIEWFGQHVAGLRVGSIVDDACHLQVHDAIERRSRAVVPRHTRHEDQTETADEPSGRLPRCAHLRSGVRPTKPLRHGGVVSRTADDPAMPRGARCDHAVRGGHVPSRCRRRESDRRRMANGGGDGRPSIRWVGENRCERRVSTTPVRSASRAERQEDGNRLASYFQIDCHIVPGASAQDAAERLALVAHTGSRMRAASNGRTSQVRPTVLDASAYIKHWREGLNAYG